MVFMREKGEGSPIPAGLWSEVSTTPLAPSAVHNCCLKVGYLGGWQFLLKPVIPPLGPLGGSFDIIFLGGAPL